MAISQKLELVKTNPHCQNNKIVKTFLHDLQINKTRGLKVDSRNQKKFTSQVR